MHLKRLFLLLIAFSISGTVLAGQENPERIAVAIVNEKTIFTDDPMLTKDSSTDPRVQRQALEQTIESELLLQQAQQLTIPALAEKVESRLIALRQRNPALYKERKEAEIREMVIAELRVDAYLRQQGVADPKIPEEEIRIFYEKTKENFLQPETIHLRQILAPVGASDSNEIRERAREKIALAREELLAGRPFIEVFAENTSDPTAPPGGDLGFLPRGLLPPECDEIAFSLPPGQISQPIATRFGYHLLEVIERRPERFAPYEEVRDFLQKYLQEGARRKKYRDLIEQLRATARIEILPGQAGNRTHP